ncbi:nucleolar protein 10 [Microplitis demolitor]|uniref:nucleolar protein 10 n=1 Tax=Microplitis demolitor TaxID=69319 RepID=UPI0006D4D559|nr:nucleolar protein 10 [Microplitis demolitor]
MMHVASPNDIKIYDLSAGISLPEWISAQKRRSLLKKHARLRSEIQLIQDFDMPGVSTSVKISRDGQSILATGIYKPRVKCFDTKELSMKFERCFDSEVVNFQILSDDYSKLVFLHCDRHVEIHAAHGKYYRLRIPRFGRDLEYHYPSCDLFIVGVSNEIYRLSLERGQFLKPFESESAAINKCAINPEHHLLTVGTQEGKVEAWDPRIKDKVGTLDCAFYCATQNLSMDTVPSVTSLKFKGGLTMAVGTATGQILLYDIRSNKPFLMKDHMYGLPIRGIDFNDKMDLVYSMDSSIVKIWEKNTGKLYTSIESKSDFNDLCVVPDTGFLFIANEAPKIKTYFIPSLGPAPSWCSRLDNLTEEMEETNYETVYDDYKFVTEKELDELGFSHLKGTNMLRAYMHGYFMDVRLWRKAKDAIQPFSFEEFKKKKIREAINENRASKIKIDKLPQINKELAYKLMENETNNKNIKKKKGAESLLKDDRFKTLFTNPDFQVDKNAEEFILHNPVIAQLDKSKEKKLRALETKQPKEKILTAFDDDDHRQDSDDELLRDSSSDDDKPWSEDVKKKYRQLKRIRREAEENEEDEDEDDEDKVKNKDGGGRVGDKKQPRFFEVKEGVEFRGGKAYMKKRNKASLEERLQREEASSSKIKGARGNREMTFTINKKKFGKGRDAVKHRRADQKGLLRPAGNIGKRKKF